MLLVSFVVLDVGFRGRGIRCIQARLRMRRIWRWGKPLSNRPLWQSSMKSYATRVTELRATIPNGLSLGIVGFSLFLIYYVCYGKFVVEQLG